MLSATGYLSGQTGCTPKQTSLGPRDRIGAIVTKNDCLFGRLFAQPSAPVIALHGGVSSWSLLGLLRFGWKLGNGCLLASL